MSLNIEELAKLANRLEQAGQTEKAKDLRGMIERLAEPTEMGEQPDIQESGPVEVSPEEILKDLDDVRNEIATKKDDPTLKEKVQQLIAQLQDFIEELMVPPPPGSGAVPVGAIASKTIGLADSLDALGWDKEADMADEVVKTLSSTQVIEKSADDTHLQEHAPGAFDLESKDRLTEEEEAKTDLPGAIDSGSSERVLPVEIKKDVEIFLANPTEEAGESIGTKIKQYLEQSAVLSDEAAASEIERIEREKGVVWATKLDVLEKLAGLADRLDAIGAPEEADLIDGFIEKHATDVERVGEADTEQSKRYDSKYHHSLQVREPKAKQERIDREGRDEHHVHTYQSSAGMLSSRYCPDHIGVQMGRVGENTFQCPLDGQIYNWESGWTDLDGNEHPGGSVAGQTPDSSGIATPHRIFDSRENILNRVN